MDIVTRIQNGIMVMDLDSQLEPLEATKLARELGLSGKLKIEITISCHDEITYASYTVNEQDKITSAIFPYRIQEIA